MVKFTDKIQLIKESNFSFIDNIYDEYQTKVKELDDEYRLKFIKMCEKILRKFEKHTQRIDISFMELDDEFHMGDIILYNLEFERDGIYLFGEKYTDDNTTSFTIKLSDIDTDFASKLLRNLSERNYIMKYLSYDTVKKINIE